MGFLFGTWLVEDNEVKVIPCTLPVLSPLTNGFSCETWRKVSSVNTYKPRPKLSSIQYA